MLYSVFQLMVQKYGADSDEEKISEIVKYSILINSKVATKTVSICFLID